MLIFLSFIIFSYEYISNGKNCVQIDFFRFLNLKILTYAESFNPYPRVATRP